jgi:hypothetical protein
MPDMTGSFEQFTTNHGYEACWSTPMQSVVRSNATGGQVECSIPIGIPTKNQNRY